MKVMDFRVKWLAENQESWGEMSFLEFVPHAVVLLEISFPTSQHIREPSRSIGQYKGTYILSVSLNQPAGMRNMLLLSATCRPAQGEPSISPSLKSTKLPGSHESPSFIHSPFLLFAETIIMNRKNSQLREHRSVSLEKGVILPWIVDQLTGGIWLSWQRVPRLFTVNLIA